MARFLAEYLIANGPSDKVIVVGGGCSDPEKAHSSNMSVDPSVIYAAHEEAVTRLIVR